MAGGNGILDSKGLPVAGTAEAVAEFTEAMGKAMYDDLVPVLTKHGIGAAMVCGVKPSADGKQMLCVAVPMGDPNGVTMAVAGMLLNYPPQALQALMGGTPDIAARCLAALPHPAQLALFHMLRKRVQFRGQ